MESAHFDPARRLMDEIFVNFLDVDKSFVREFQSHGFSPRLFELALFAYLFEQGYELDRTNPAPDFVHLGEMPFAIEVTTTNPPEDVEHDDLPSPEDIGLVPDDLSEASSAFTFQVGKALRRKLLKRYAGERAYWQQAHVTGIPFVIAVAAFHDEHAQLHPLGIVAEYLYGRRDVANYDDEGNLILTAARIKDHRHKGKYIPSGLFSRPEASHLSGVLFSNSHTISKFNRIGVERGYCPPDVAMFRFGTTYDPDPNASIPVPFAYMVEPCPPAERETFAEGLNLFLNPWAENPLNPRALRGINVNELLEDGRVMTTFADIWQPYASKTVTMRGKHAYVHAFIKMCRLTGELPI